MIDREELRRVMELEGHDPETIDKVLAWYYGTPVGPDVLAALLDLLRAELAEAAQSMTEAWEALTGAAQPLQKVENHAGRPAASVRRIKRPRGHSGRPGWPGQAAEKSTNKEKPEALSLRLFFLKIFAFCA